jgi:IS605 OrfB family transposase
MIKTLSYRIKDSNCGEPLTSLAASVNTVWNFCNETQHTAVRWDKRWPSAFDLQKLTTSSSRLLGLHSQTIQAVCEEYAIRRKQAHKRWLRWRGKRSLGWIPFKVSSIKVDGDTITYQGQKYRCWLSRPIEGTIKTGSFSQDARARWYINFQCECAEPEVTTNGEAVGIDLGLKTLATLSTGEKVESKQFYRDVEDTLASARRARQTSRVRALHAKVASRRKDFLHKLSTRLTKEFRQIFVGDVNASKLAKTRMAKSVLDAGWSAFRTMLSYKALARRVVFKVVDEAWTSRTCSECGALSGPKGIAGLGIRDWVCVECGACHDRDHNSAKLILGLGHQPPAVGIPGL